MADKGEKYYPNGYASIGYVEVAPVDYGSGKQTTNYNYQSRLGGQSSYSQTSTVVKNYDKQTGSYARATNTQAFSTGDTFKERSTGRVGYNEFKTTSTYKVGDKSGYTEYQVSERVRNVTYGGSSYSNKGNNCNNKYLQ
ncbi:hypothetical protein CCACVL1_07096 [Corchorus capsularis]|uniref:Uncharacterized protein n=1 Tax=Corchorus capsularis TaxID=210143 RepID=A0A1R3J9N9_COCAP|nr:hypothetical protein CCACVL1_07096 [Corchorus capsularis]